MYVKCRTYFTVNDTVNFFYNDNHVQLENKNMQNNRKRIVVLVKTMFYRVKY